MRLSAFPRPQLAPPSQLATPHAQRERYVTSEDELISAIGEVAHRSSIAASGQTIAFGGEIVIASSMVMRKTPILIPYQCAGLTIRALAGMGLIPFEGDQGVIFRAEAALLTLRDLFVAFGGTLETPTAWFNTLVEAYDPSTAGYDAEGLTIERCRLYVDRIFVDESEGNCDNASIAFNHIISAPNGTHAASIVLDSRGQVACYNVLDDGGGDSITVENDGESCRLIGNDLGGGDITSSASGGLNSIWSNVRSGTITAAGTDSQGGNT